METLTIEVPEEKSNLVKSLLKELGVVIHKKSKARKPNALTLNTIEEARKGINVGEPITDIDKYIDSL